MKNKSIPLILCTLFVFVSCNNFNKHGKPLFKNLSALHSLSIERCKLTASVWRTAIFDHRYALCKSSKFEDCYVSDFNNAILRMQNEPDVAKANITIDSLRALVVSEVKKVKSSKDVSYDKLISFYTNVVELSKKASVPEGSLQSFSEDVMKMERDINLLEQEIIARNPDFTE